MTGEQLINEVEKISQANIEFAQRKLSHLSIEQVTWRSANNTWSIAEVCAHLNKYAEFYHPVFEDKITSTRYQSPTMNFISSPLGRASWRSMKLGNANNVKRKFRAAVDYNPTLKPNLVSGEDVQCFINEQVRFLDILDKAKNINIRKAKIPVSISKIIKFRFGDGLLFVCYHNERHLEQIKKIMKHPQFPKK